MIDKNFYSDFKIVRFYSKENHLKVKDKNKNNFIFRFNIFGCILSLRNKIFIVILKVRYFYIHTGTYVVTFLKSNSGQIV